MHGLMREGRREPVLYSTCGLPRAEILAGLAMMPDGKRKQGLMDAAAAMFDEDFANRCRRFDSDAANHNASIVSERTWQGKLVSVEDAQIASVARSNGLSIATRNGKDFAGIEPRNRS